MAFSHEHHTTCLKVATLDRTIPSLAHLEASLGKVSVGVKDERVVVVELHALDLILLGPLVLHVVLEAPCEGDLGPVVDVGAHLRRHKS